MLLEIIFKWLSFGDEMSGTGLQTGVFLKSCNCQRGGK